MPNNKSDQTSLDEPRLGNDELIGELTIRVRSLHEQIGSIDDQMAELHFQKSELVGHMANLQQTIVALGGRPESFTQQVPTLAFSPTVNFPPGFPLVEAIAGILASGETLHRDDIVAQLTTLNFPWNEGDPVRMVGTTLGRNRQRFVEVGLDTRRWRLK